MSEITSAISANYSEFSTSLSRTLMFFFQLAWRLKFRLPSLITAIFLAFDIRVSVEIQLEHFP